MGNEESMAVLKQGDYVLWEFNGSSGVGRVLLVDIDHVWVLDKWRSDGVDLDAHYAKKTKCTKIDPAVAKLYGNV